MRSHKAFAGGLAVFGLIYLWYGIERFKLGVDFTDEGAYMAWPLRMLFGERPFTAELLTLLRPIEAYLFVPFKVHPSMTLFEFRMIGWILHLLSFSVLATYLFRLSRAPFRSLLIASLPLFACNIFGLITPSYNTISSDFLLIALCLLGLAGPGESGGDLLLGAASGLALFIAALAHPALNLVPGAIAVHEGLNNGLVSNLARRRLTASNLATVVFVACALAFSLYFVESGALASWSQRMDLVRISAGTAHEHPWRILAALASCPFSYNHTATAYSLTALAVVLTGRILRDPRFVDLVGRASAMIGFLSVILLVHTFSKEPYHLPICFALIGLTVIGMQVLGARPPAPLPDFRPRFLLVLSAASAALYAVFTYYFNPYRSWQSGLLGLPFGFAVGLSLLFESKVLRSGPLRLLLTVVLAVAVACLGRDHYLQVQRDAAPPQLQAVFQIPRLRGIKSTEERVKAVEGLYAYLQPKLVRGEPLLVFDGAPMLYYLFQARPTYGLAWAVRYSQTRAALQQLNRELLAKPLPEYAIRTLVDLAGPVWANARRINYDDYPLNDTLLFHYRLEHTIFPFEIWHLVKPASLNPSRTASADAAMEAPRYQIRPPPSLRF